jgi:hypothetical protein
MYSTLALEKGGNWRLRLIAETDAERHMISTLSIPWAVSGRLNAAVCLEASPVVTDGKYDVIVVEVRDDSTRAVSST